MQEKESIMVVLVPIEKSVPHRLFYSHLTPIKDSYNIHKCIRMKDQRLIFLPFPVWVFILTTLLFVFAAINFQLTLIVDSNLFLLIKVAKIKMNLEKKGFQFHIGLTMYYIILLLYDLVTVSPHSVLVTIQCVLVPIRFDCGTAAIQFVL